MIHDGPLVATFHVATRPVPVPVDVRHACCSRSWRRSPAGSRSRRRRARCIVEHLGGDAVVIPNGVAVAALRQRRAVRRLPPARARRRSASSAATTSRARAWTCSSTRSTCWCRSRPDLRLLVAGRGDADEFLAELPPDGRGPGRPARPGERGRQGAAAAQRRRLLRAEHRPGELRRDPARGDGRADRRSWPATSTRSGGCSAGGAAGQQFAGRRPGRAGRARWRRCSTTRRCGRGWSRPGPQAVAPYDWSVIVADVLRVYELAIAGAGAHRGSRHWRPCRPGRRHTSPTRLPSAACSLSVGSILAVVVAILLTIWITFTLTRLDRLHARVDAAQAALDAQLVRRAAALLHVAEAPDTGLPTRPAGRATSRVAQAALAPAAADARPARASRTRWDGRSPSC